jgi:hypothetical protein
MRQRDKPNFPRADRDGLYGCCRCGTYARVSSGALLACGACKSPNPMVRVGDIVPPIPRRKQPPDIGPPPTV